MFVGSMVISFLVICDLYGVIKHGVYFTSNFAPFGCVTV